MRLWSRLPSLLEAVAGQRRPKIASLESLAGFMAAQSAFVAQKCTIDYCQARSGLMWRQLEKESEFRAALDRARWEAYPQVLSDVGVMIEGSVRPAIAETFMLRWADWLAGAYTESLNRYGPPRHRAEGAAWDEDVDQFRRRLGKAQMAAPRPVHEIGGESGRALHRLMPIHPSLTRQDATMICNNVRLRLGRVYENLERDLDRAAIAAQLAARSA